MFWMYVFVGIIFLHIKGTSSFNNYEINNNIVSYIKINFLSKL